jgi:hypothetical protein
MRRQYPIVLTRTGLRLTGDFNRVQDLLTNTLHDDPQVASRRSFLLSSGGLLGPAWLAAQWPAITAAAHSLGARVPCGGIYRAVRQAERSLTVRRLLPKPG